MLPLKTPHLVAVVVVLFALNFELAFGHKWESWHWNYKQLGVRNTAVYFNEAEAALADWDDHTEVKFVKRPRHKDVRVQVYDGNYGATGWAGLASIEVGIYEGIFGASRPTPIKCCEILHAHVKYNSNYTYTSGTGTASGIRGVFCQEIGHALGLDHSDHGCMGKGYYNNSNTTVSHNWRDVDTYTHKHIYGGFTED